MKDTRSIPSRRRILPVAAVIIIVLFTVTGGLSPSGNPVASPPQVESPLAVESSALARRHTPAEDPPPADNNRSREILLFDSGWKFHLGHAADPALDFGFGTGTLFAKAGEPVGAVDVKFVDTAWSDVDLPHDWVVGLDFVRSDDEAVKSHGYKPVGRPFPATTIGWYRRSFAVAEGDTGRRFVVRFDGVFRDCIVWLNGHYLGNNLGGYMGFSYDITDYLNYGQKNVLVVRVDASQYEGWFYEGAGIYRHVWLVKHDPVHIPEYGVVVRTDLLTGEDRFRSGPESGRTVDVPSANVTVGTTITNRSGAVSGGMLVSRVVAPDGSVAAETGPLPFTLGARETQTLAQSVVVGKPRLWSIETPALYSLVSIVKREGSVIDSLTTTFGIRTIAFDKDSGFILNGKRVKIKGVCCHQDHAGVGSALPDRLQAFRIEKLKEMGANAYRSSHNPPTPELLDACDRLGMLVLDEHRLMGSSPEFTEQFKKLILRDRNHPSVILWSLGNEEWFIHNSGVGARIARALLDIQQEFDPTRLSTYAANNGNHFEGINSVVPVRGFNYMSIADIDLYRKDHPDQPLIGTEEASTLCTRGEYETDTLKGYLEDHDVNKPGWGSTAETWWSFYAARPWLAGGFVWTGFDYRGEPTPYSWPCINSHFGIMDVCGFPKNNYYYYQAWWSEKDVLQLSPHWNREGREGDTVRVWCNSNCERVELFLNGKSLGLKAMPANSHLEWLVPYRAGVLEARGERNGRTIRTKVETTGAPEKIRLLPDRSTIDADGEDVSVVTVLAVDADGREVPDAGQRIDFAIDGPGKIIGVGNGDPSSHEPDVRRDTSEWSRRLFNGRAQVIVQSEGKPGTIVLRASSPGLSRAEEKIAAKRAMRRPSVPVWEPPVLRHLGLGRKAVYETDFSPKYPGTGLLDGVRGTADFRDGTWQGFEGNDLAITVDLGKKATIDRVTVGVLSDNASWIFLPREVELFISDDGVRFRSAASETFESPERSEPAGVKRIRLETGGKDARYVRIIARSRGTCPAWHTGAGKKAWLFADEIVIE